MLDADLRELLESLIAHQVEFLVVGGHAVAFHGYPRLTVADFTADDRVIQLGRAPNRIDLLT
ncbi:MAG TPA: hypothetical protein VE869_03375 [Gemmatimonas sp.]|nr:hypothetical protein [Gemmatimonas sp.]